MSTLSGSIMEYETVALDEKENCVLIIDQTKLPGKTEIIRLKSAQEIWNAIYLLKVRGAPAIGVSAAFGIYVLARQIAGEIVGQSTRQLAGQFAGQITGQIAQHTAGEEKEAEFEAFYRRFKEQKEYLDSARPTAVNLSWALNRMERVCLQAGREGKGLSEIIELLHREAVKIKEEDIQVCRSIGEYGLGLVKPGDGILTHCNAGRLAACRYGTATAPIYLGQERGYHFRVFADETRPLLQGARLTACELKSAGVDVTLICDNMSATVMKNGWVNAIFVGCDRVAANGDTANKIGTSMVAIAARRYGIPFYVCAPTATIDLATPTGAEIRIEERPGEEVTKMWYKEPMAPEDVKVFNPAFDVTDNELVTAIITENGIAEAPFENSLQKLCRTQK